MSLSACNLILYHYFVDKNPDSVKDLLEQVSSSPEDFIPLKKGNAYLFRFGINIM